MFAVAPISLARPVSFRVGIPLCKGLVLLDQMRINYIDD